MFGKTHLLKRKVAWFAQNKRAYTYSGKPHIALGFTKEINDLMAWIYEKTSLHFNALLANYYPDGNAYMGFHADNEKILGPDPVIASLSLGAERPLVFQHNKQKDLKKEVLLHHGSLLVMHSGVQHNFKHALPKRSKITAERINLTFRNIL